MDSTSSAKVQHVNKKSSDELLRKFAELGSDSVDKAPARKELRVSKLRKRCKIMREVDLFESPSNGRTSLLERRSLLPLVPTRRLALLQQLRIGRSQFRTRGVKNMSILGTIEKTWNKTVEGTSKVFMVKHYHRHKRLINDIV
ncbi:hypothetical protein I3843_10G025700 [Carya illinoinensis]|uniref:Uncharacterized protein n=1 Tax=Carya illinoinensis TaxID=32201 RepID=A0A8T1P1J3_CARIL|nr:uncharacterized protein LOC122278884 [Carya illinoinensis]KAG2683306.1 hypothetical protein I3760_10G026200 [Carya illinoinensis]KAG2683307.1 hypothetical protein I3760_10G026200 [Carya illinoinensis]KAG6638305.1 hypothetical protein CIPAW_10G026400 [Carya illinoinensis]KAG6638306.1 hypothetical protein CIPAW_10G026400 [Carya illinoinensis]KAG6690661.1 hypothetical protein I3842_10G025900 [Carya illinoinensis]